MVSMVQVVGTVQAFVVLFLWLWSLVDVTCAGEICSLFQRLALLVLGLALYSLR